MTSIDAEFIEQLVKVGGNAPVPWRLPAGYRKDTLGMGHVLYWPNVKAPASFE